MNYDIIGDIHGHADQLSTALKTRVTMASIATYNHPVWRTSSNQHSIREFLPENRDSSY